MNTFEIGQSVTIDKSVDGDLDGTHAIIEMLGAFDAIVMFDDGSKISVCLTDLIIEAADQYIVISGSPDSGFTHTGPFLDHDDALNSVGTGCKTDSWFIVTLYAPKNK